MIVRADARHIPLADESVQCIVTSPPYFALRDYGVVGQIGLEPTLQEYVETMINVFRELQWILKSDGTVWLNLGDSYNGSFKGTGGVLNSPKQRSNHGSYHNATPVYERGLKQKDLLGMPWRVAFALQADGWWLRSDIIWHKPNPMPESVADRPTRSHEYLFLLTKRQHYYYDADAIREAAVCGNDLGLLRGLNAGESDQVAWHAPSILKRQQAGIDSRTAGSGRRNKRDVWTINSEPTPEAHFATFPTKLIEPCILAGSRKGDIVYDPFLGSGTVGVVCERLERRWVGTELSADYIEIAKKRTSRAHQEGILARAQQSLWA